MAGFSAARLSGSFTVSPQAAYFSVHMHKTNLLHLGITTSEHIITISNLVKQWVSVPKQCMNSFYIKLCSLCVQDFNIFKYVVRILQ